MKLKHFHLILCWIFKWIFLLVNVHLIYDWIQITCVIRIKKSIIVWLKYKENKSMEWYVKILYLLKCIHLKNWLLYLNSMKFLPNIGIFWNYILWNLSSISNLVCRHIYLILISSRLLWCLLFCNGLKAVWKYLKSFIYLFMNI